METYDHDYATCEETYVTLRILSVNYDMESITRTLEILPTTTRVGNPSGDRPNVWLLQSKGSVNSLDMRKHLDWLLERLSGKTQTLKDLTDQGFSMDVSCYWRSRDKHGGPSLSAIHMQKLGNLGLSLWFDCY